MKKLTFANFTLPEIKDFDEGIFALQHLHRESQELLLSIKDQQKSFVRKKFQEGYIISTLMETTGRGDGMMERISQATGIGTSTLYDAMKCYNSPLFEQSSVKLEVWFEEQELANKSVTWGRVRNMLAKHKEPELVEIDRERQDIENRAIQLEDDAERLTAKITHINESPHVISQVQGVVGAALEVAQERRDQMALMEVKPERIKDKNYLKFIKEQPCVVTGIIGVDPHHFLTGGMGTKGSDYATIPLTRELHNELHNQGVKVFQKKYQVDFWKEMAKLMHVYFVGVPPVILRDAA